MKVSLRNTVTALMTLHLSDGDQETRPLSVRELDKLATWLARHHRSTEDLLRDPVMTVLEAWDDPRLTVDRLQRLLDRHALLETRLEVWLDGHGLVLMGRSDPEYPERLRTRLGDNAPPLLFTKGRPELLSNNGLAIVGSRNASPSELSLARQFGAEASQRGLNVVSGGAPGVDSAAIDGALGASGTAIMVSRDSLIKTMRLPAIHSQIEHGDLLLVTPFAPDTRFTTANAMARNKYIYCLANAAIVVASQAERGGTYAGAVEALKAGWIPVGVVPSDNPASGSPALVERGGVALRGDPATDLEGLLDRPAFGEPMVATDAITEIDSSGSFPGMMDEFVRYWSILLPAPTTVKELGDRLNLQQSQVRAWLKPLIADGRVRKSIRPVRYTLLD